MRLLPISICTSGMRLGKKIYNEDGIVLLNVNVELTETLIQRLAHHGIDFLYINDPRTEDIIIPELLSDETRLKATKTIKGHFRKLMGEAGGKKATNYFFGKDFRDVMNLLIEDLSMNKDAMIMLTNIQLTDHYLYEHSLNVCIYATILGMANGYSREELVTFGLGALLHDIGKTQISLNTLRKPGRLDADEFTEVKRHAELGFRILKEEPNIPLISAHCAFQHHERLDGSGYPRGLKGSEIHDYARWIGLVDAFDAMTSNRVYRSAMLPHQAMEVLFTGSGTLFDQDKIAMFRDRVAIYPIGITVTINSGEKGVVVDLNASVPQRPIVRMIQGVLGEDIKEPYEIDLSKKLSVMIVGVN